MNNHFLSTSSQYCSSLQRELFLSVEQKLFTPFLFWALVFLLILNKEW